MICRYQKDYNDSGWDASHAETLSNFDDYADHPYGVKFIDPNAMWIWTKNWVTRAYDHRTVDESVYCRWKRTDLEEERSNFKWWHVVLPLFLILVIGALIATCVSLYKRGIICDKTKPFPLNIARC